MYEKYYTQEQLDQLAKRREELGEEGMEKAQRDWQELIAEVKDEMEKGTDPGSDRLRELAGRWNDLVGQFTGGDPGIKESLAAMYKEQGPEKASHGMLDQGVSEFIGKTMAIVSRESKKD